MKKSSWIQIVAVLVVVLLLSFLATQFLLPKDSRTYSLTSCLNDSITEDMDVYDIAKLYRDNACVAVRVYGYNNESKSYYSSQGSGVCIASNGYSSQSSGYSDLDVEATKGSYIATNYHVIEWIENEDYSNIELSIITEDENEYEAQYLWGSSQYDVAILYIEENLNYVKMVDRWIDCDSEDKLDIEQIFTIGSPLNLQNLNDFTTGYVRSNNEMVEYTAVSEYYYQSVRGWQSVSIEDALPNTFSYYEISYLSNIYEDVISMSVEISPGNSGGGVFDSNGNLVALATLSTDVSQTNGNQINGAVPVYPLIKVLDKVIANNESKEENKIYTISSCGLAGLDANEAELATYLHDLQETELRTVGVSSYYLNGTFYSTIDYQDEFSFEDEGYLIISNDNSFEQFDNLTKGCIIKSGKINDGELKTISDRNDFSYLLFNLDEGDSLLLNYLDENGSSQQLVATI